MEVNIDVSKWGVAKNLHLNVVLLPCFAPDEKKISDFRIILRHLRMSIGIQGVKQDIRQYSHIFSPVNRDRDDEHVFYFAQDNQFPIIFMVILMKNDKKHGGFFTMPKIMTKRINFQPKLSAFCIIRQSPQKYPKQPETLD